MRHELPALPFATNALEPHISAETLRLHHGKHHKAYVEKLNELIQGTEFENSSLEEIVRNAPEGPLFNNAAQNWNHSFLWKCLSPGSTRPQGELLSAIERDFGSVATFYEKFGKAALDQFGSGWAWIVSDADGKLSIQSSSNAQDPLRTGMNAILTCDVWEHAYYLDYRNDRAKYLKMIPEVLNWDFASQNYQARNVQLAA